MKTIIKNIVISVLLGVYLFTTSIGRIEVFKLALCSPDTITQESSSSKPKTIDPRPTWNYRRQMPTKISIQVPADEAVTSTFSPVRFETVSVSPLFECTFQNELRFTDSSPRSPPLA